MGNDKGAQTPGHTEGGRPASSGTTRRRLLALLAMSVAGAGALKIAFRSRGPGAFGPDAQAARKNFASVYLNDHERDAFAHFLENVFTLYPPEELHQLIEDVTRAHATQAPPSAPPDEAIYRALVPKLQEIAPFLGDLRTGVPALFKQKGEMTRQTLALLGQTRRVNGYLEVGENGRYQAALRDELEFEGPVFLTSTQAPGFGPIDLLDREQLTHLGTHLPLNDYAASSLQSIPGGSLDLITVYIGLHHCVPEIRGDYITALKEKLSPQGTVIIRDHDAKTPELVHRVALAHDVFNLGTGAGWGQNAAEFRDFYSLAELEAQMNGAGLTRRGEPLFQQGDPTKNALLAFVRGHA